MVEEYTPSPRRGRPTNAEIAARNAAAEPVSKRAEDTRQQRRRRADAGQTAGLKLHVPEELRDRNSAERWINDDGQRIHAKTVLDDWDIVKDKDIDGQREGTPVKRLVGKGDAGQPLHAYLCRKPKEWYDEDKGKEQDAIKRREEDIRRGAPQGPDGLTGPQAYVPEGGIRITRGD